MRPGRGSSKDAARGELKEVYAPVDAAGKESKPSLKEYPVIPWDKIDLNQFNLVPKVVYAAAEESGRRLGNVSHHSGGVGARLSLWMRVLHGDRILWRLDSLSHQ